MCQRIRRAFLFGFESLNTILFQRELIIGKQESFRKMKQLFIQIKLLFFILLIARLKMLLKTYVWGIAMTGVKPGQLEKGIEKDWKLSKCGATENDEYQMDG